MNPINQNKIGNDPMKRKRAISPVGYCKVPVRYFQRGKQKRYFIEYMDGIPLSEWIENNMDPITAIQDGRYDLLDKISKEYDYDEKMK